MRVMCLIAIAVALLVAPANASSLGESVRKNWIGQTVTSPVSIQMCERLEESRKVDNAFLDRNVRARQLFDSLAGCRLFKNATFTIQAVAFDEARNGMEFAIIKVEVVGYGIRFASLSEDTSRNRLSWLYENASRQIG